MHPEASRRMSAGADESRGNRTECPGGGAGGGADAGCRQRAMEDPGGLLGAHICSRALLGRGHGAARYCSVSVLT